MGEADYGCFEMAPEGQRGAQLSDLSDDAMVVIDDLYVTYRVYEERRTRMREVVARGFKSRAYREIQAVRGVSLTAYAGEAVGVIGRNGSGKSTLLRAAAGLLPATRGAVYARYQPSLLGVGAALNASLSGRRNIILGGLALGLSLAEIEEQVDSIVEFADLADFIDLPLKAYSTGMRARLHFAIATAVKPEILLIDEALAVGDQDFKERSWTKIRELQAAAGTIFLVTHSLGEIKNMCQRAIWLDGGRVVEEGPAQKVVAAYQSTKRG